MEGSYRNLKRNSLRKLQHESLSPEVADSEVSYFISRLYFDKLRTNPSLRGGEVRAPSLRAKKKPKQCCKQADMHILDVRYPRLDPWLSCVSDAKGRTYYRSGQLLSVIEVTKWSLDSIHIETDKDDRLSLHF